MQFAMVLFNGDYRLDFSETMFKMENLMFGGKNLTLLNEYKDLIFNITYRS